MTVTADVASAQLPDLLKEIQAGNEVVLTEKNEPVARILPVPARAQKSGTPRELILETFPDVKVLKPHFTHFEIAEEMARRHDEP
jgi:prevent-host-death family protein